MSLPLEIRRLSQRDPRNTFSAGEDDEAKALNQFFAQYAGQNDSRGLSATSVALSGGTIAGFVTITPGAIDPSLIASHAKVGHHPAPLLILARMATDLRFQKQGVGEQLMHRVVFERAIDLADNFGCVGVYVDPKHRAVTYYSRFGFIPLATREATPPPMFLPLKTLRAARSP